MVGVSFAAGYPEMEPNCGSQLCSQVSSLIRSDKACSIAVRLRLTAERHVGRSLLVVGDKRMPPACIINFKYILTYEYYL